MHQVKQDYQGDPIDDELNNGPIEKRECQDFICCVLFITSGVLMIIIAILGWSKGHPDRLTYPFDPDNRACGQDAQVKDYPYIYMVMPWPDHFNRSVCVKSCPKVPFPEKSSEVELECVINSMVPSCKQNPQSFSISDYSTTILSTQLNLDTAILIYDSTGYFDRICLPNTEAIAKNLNMKDLFPATNLQEYFSDLKDASGIILASAGIAFIIGLFYMVIMRYLSGCLTWTAILLYFVALLLLGAYFLEKSKDMEKVAINTQEAEMKQRSEDNSQNLKYLAYVVWGVAAVSFIIFLCIFNQIRIAIAIIKSGALFVGEVISIFMIPPVVCVVTCLWWAWWLVVFVFVFSIGNITGSKTTPFASIEWDENTRYLLCYHLFGGLWINAFIMSVNQLILASSAAIWYFAKPGDAHLPVTRSIYRCFRYHLGSLAFGSLLLAIVQFLRIIMEYISRQMKNAGAGNNAFARCIVNCLKCYLACFERFIKFLNRNAFIQIAITGKNFCGAARDAFYLITRNPVKFGAVSGIGQVFIFIGKLFVSLVTTFICYMILTSADYYKNKLFSPLLPTIFILGLSYIIGNIFLSVYGMAVDTILQCACMDEELSAKQNKKPQHCPGPLLEFFDSQVKNRK